MTKVLLKLHARLWKAGFKKNVSLIIQLVAMALYGVGGAVSLVLLMLMPLLEGEAFGNHDLAIGAGALGVAAFWLYAGMVPSGEFHLQPEKFAALPLRAKDIATGMALATLLQLRSLTALVCSLITIAAGVFMFVQEGNMALIPVWVVGNVAAWFLAVFGAEAIAQTASLSKNRAATERRSIIASLVFFVVWMGFNLLSNGKFSADTLNTIARWSGFTPVGGFNAMAVGVADGDYLLTGIGAAMGVAALVGVWWLWQHSFTAALSEPTASDIGGQVKDTSGSVLLFGQRPTPEAAIRSRMWRYMRRDNRLMQSLIVLPLMAFGFLGVGSVLEDSPLPYMGGVFLAMSSGSMIMNCLGLDGPANWVHMTCGTRPAHVLRGYAVANGVATLGLLAIYVPVFLHFTTGSSVAPFFAMAMPAAALCNVGVSLVLAAYNPYPAAAPGTPAMKDRSQQSGNAFLATFVTLGGGALPLLPGILVSLKWFVPGAVLTYITAVVVLWLGFRLATRRVETHWPEIFARVRQYA